MKPTREYSAMLYRLADAIDDLTRLAGMDDSEVETIREAAERLDTQTVHIACLKKQFGALLAVCDELAESAAYWSEYDVPLGIVDRLHNAIATTRSAIQ